MSDRVQWGHVLSRGLEYALTFFLILTVNFFLPRFMPGGPLLSVLGSQSADLPVVIDDETKSRLMDYYHLNDPLHLQFVHYLIDAAHLDFGYSIFYNVPVVDVISGRLPWTLLLMGTALLLSTVLGILLGLESSWNREKRLDNLLLIVIPLFRSVPVFFLGSIFIFLFGYRLGLFPVSGALTPYMDYQDFSSMVKDVASHLVLPLACLSAFEMPGTYLLVRNVCSQQLERPYVLMDIARGLKDRHVKRHILLNSIGPVVNQVAAMLGFMVGGTLFVETVFSYPGMGLLVYNAFIERDYPVLQGAFVFMSLFVLTCNYAADIVCSYIDGRAGQE
ncbi:Oligopeptide transport system permease protein OppB [Methanosarcina horonobensis HB-1 = JCM 15518]|uniref:Oligopeptide transport system permease protein OppB n=1 Tax=Methanosarcina horonobensis HB-1 = JCM 15518 TaxID=1434110 RepID=A0A0E3S5S6_9EURY|nr:ABC transporter permease [Methanosarcina horonobensis]AKB76524.1 Oligopeptide transport system permease protein OppB [Methanosarcina horonobensis HB-1 = JCM 15518]